MLVVRQCILLCHNSDIGITAHFCKLHVCYSRTMFRKLFVRQLRFKQKSMQTSSTWIVSEIQLTEKFHYVNCWQKQRGGELMDKGRNLQAWFTANKIYHITAPVTCQTSSIFTQVVSGFYEELIFGQIRGHVQVVKYLLKVLCP